MKLFNPIYTLLFTIVSVLIPHPSFGQKTEAILDKIEFKELADNISARTELVTDHDGDPCALIQIYAPLIDSLIIDGSSVYKVKQQDNCWRVWVIDGATKITVGAPSMKPTEIVFKNYGYPKLHQKATYELRLTIGHEAEELRYRHKTKYVDTYDFIETKTYTFINYQFAYGYPFGINVGFCKKSGLFAYLNYVDSSFQWGGNGDDIDDGSKIYRKWLSFGAGPMFRLSPHFYWQIGLGLSTEGDGGEMAFNCGSTAIYRIKHFNIGLGYYYYGASGRDDRSVFKDGITVQIGLNF